MNRHRTVALLLSLLLAVMTSGAAAGQSAADVSGEGGDRVAAAYRVAGDKARAVEWLGKLAELKSCFSPSPATFASIANSAEFKAVKERIAAASPVVHHAALAFTVTEKDPIPEGMAYDAAERVFYLSSLRKRK